MPNVAKNRYGMTIGTSSPGAAGRCQEGIDLLLSQGYGPEEKFQEAVEIDEGFALAHGCLAYMYMLRAQADQAREAAEHALSLTPGISRREWQHIEAISLWVHGQGTASIALIKEHLAEFPQDALMIRLAQRLYMLGCSGAGVANFPAELLALLNSIAPYCGEDWAFLGSYAFAHHENGYLDQAMTLARRSLDLNPSNAVASHSVTHVYFEKGEHHQGDEFLGEWLHGFDSRAPYHVHLSWHLALFELAMGRYSDAIALYEKDIRPSVIAKSAASLADASSLIWRLQMYGGEAPPMSWEEVKIQGAPAAERPGPAFRDAHAALAIAASGDTENKDKLLDRLQQEPSKGNLLAREITLPLVRGVDAFAQGDYPKAVEMLEPVFPQLTRIGGSHAQREVFEDTLLEAYLRSEQLDKAEEILHSRLMRRASPRDTFWLARAQAGKGEMEQAGDTLCRASESWLNGDPASPELARLKQLAGTLP